MVLLHRCKYVQIHIVVALVTTRMLVLRRLHRSTADNNNGRILWRRVHTIWNVGALLENSSVSIAFSVLIIFINCLSRLQQLL
jgi:hypothetical protein